MSGWAVWLGRLVAAVAVLAGVAGLMGGSWSWRHSAAVVVLATVGPAVVCTDAMWRRITRRCNNAAAVMCAVVVAGDWAVTGSAAGAVWAGTCAAVAAGGFALAAQAGKTGGGDVRAVGWCSALMGWAGGPIAAGVMLVAASVLTALWALGSDRAVVWHKRSGPYGPGFVAGGLAVGALVSF